MSEIILTNLSPEALELAVAKRDELADQALGNFMDAVAECGRYLIALEEVSPHGTFIPRLERCFTKGQATAYRYMKISRNLSRVINLRDAPSLRQALRLIAEHEEAAFPKRTRKPANLPAASPELPEVEVIDTRPPKPAAQPQPARAMFDDEDDLPPEEPSPLPRTNTKHTPATAQKIDRGSEITPADYPDDSTGMPLLEVVIAQHTTQEVVEALIAGLEGTQAKRVAAILRAAAEELDPQPVVIYEQPEAPKSDRPSKHPTVRQLQEAAAEYVETSRPAGWTPQLSTQVADWADYKQGLVGNAKVRSLKSWHAALVRIANVANTRGAGIVCEMISKAIANGWQGWEHEATSNGKPTVASTRIDTGERWDDLEYRTV